DGNDSRQDHRHPQCRRFRRHRDTDDQSLADVIGAARSYPFVPSRAFVIAASTRAGVSGVSLTSAPPGAPIAASASRTALAIAAGGATAPPSPIPFMPYSVAVAGVCRWAILIAGNSCAPGM